MPVGRGPWYEPWIPPWWREAPTVEEQEHYARQRDAFVEENGYYITLPEFEDIIHIRKPPEISRAEYQEWKQAREQGRPPNIHLAKADYLDLKRRRMESIMATPQPGWAQKIGSVMTWLDDSEDAISTGVMIGRFALKLLPRVGARFVPYLGWALLAGDLMSMGQMLWKVGTTGTGTARKGKRRGYDKVSRNPFARQAKIARAAKLAKKLPGVGETIEALQTLDNVAGVGVSFGPIMGALNDLVAGGIRRIMGEPVTIRLPSFSRDPANIRIMRAITTAPDLWNGSPDWDDEVYQNSLLAYGIGMTQLAQTGVDIGTAYDEIEDWTDYEVEGRRPWKPETVWMLEDENVNIEESIGWPTTGNRWISYGERAAQTVASFQTKFQAWALRNTHDHTAYAVNQYMIQATEMFLQGAVGPENVTYQDGDEMALIMNTFHNNFYPPPDTPDEKIQGWINRCKTYKAGSGELPSTRYQKWMGEKEGIEWSETLPIRNVGIAAEIWPEFA